MNKHLPQPSMWFWERHYGYLYSAILSKKTKNIITGLLCSLLLCAFSSDVLGSCSITRTIKNAKDCKNYTEFGFYFDINGGKYYEIWNGVFEEYSDGTAQLSGETRLGYVYLTFKNRTYTGTPYVGNCLNNPSNPRWYYYKSYQGTIGNRTIKSKMKFQVGYKANSHNATFGAAGWFTWGNVEGEINIKLSGNVDSINEVEGFEVECESNINGVWKVERDCAVTVCAGDQLSLSVNPAVSTVNWTGPNGFAVNYSNDINLGYVTADMAGTYTAEVTKNGCTVTKSIHVTVNSVNLYVEKSNDITCAYNTATLTASGSNGQVKWSTGQTSRSIQVSTLGTYTVSLVGDNGCAAASAIIVEEDRTNPTISLNKSNDLSCVNTTATLTANISGGSVRWSTGQTGTTIQVNAAGTYSATVTGANGCTTSATITVTGDTNLPTIVLNKSNDLSCVNNTVTLTANISGGSVRWSTGQTGTTIQVNAAGTYSATVTGANGCMETATIVVTGFCNPCNVNLNVRNILCDNNGTPSNPDDDTYTFEVIVTGTGTSSAGFILEFNNPFIGTAAQDGQYGQAINLGPFPAGRFTATNVSPPVIVTDGLDININITDKASSSCSTSTVVQSPGPCSNQPQPASVGNEVFNDANNNGFKDAGEQGISGVQVTLLRADGSQVATTTTDGNGNYNFGDLESGSYKIRFGTPNGLNPSPQTGFGDNDTDNNSDNNPNNGNMTDVFFLSPGENNPTIDAGFNRPAPTCPDGSSIKTPGTPCDDGNPRTGNDVILADGCSCEGTFPTCPDGSTPRTPGTPCDDGNSNTINDIFGSDGCSCQGTPKPTASVGNEVFNDANNNGFKDAGEQGIGGVRVALLRVDGSQVTTTITDGSGNYNFGNLESGSYKIMFDVPNGFTASPRTGFGDNDTDNNSDNNPNNGNMTDVFFLSPGENNPTIDAGFFAGTICDNLNFGGKIGFGNTCAGTIETCSSTSAPQIESCDLPSGGSGAIEYIWLKNEVSCSGPTGTVAQMIANPGAYNWKVIFDSNSPTLNPGNLTTSTCFLRCARRVGCEIYLGETNIVRIDVNDCNGGGNTDGTTESCGNSTSITYGNGQIKMAGQAGQEYFFTIFDKDWQTIFNCGWQCGSEHTETGLAAGEYRVIIKNSSYETICEKVITLSGGGDNSGNTGSGDNNDNNGDTGSGDNNNSGTTCTDATATGGNGQLTISNLASDARVDIFGAATGWGLKLVCEGNCNGTQTVEDLTAGEYNIKIQTFNPYCYTELKVTVTDGNAGGGNNGSGNTGGGNNGGSGGNTGNNITCGDVQITYGNGTIDLKGQAGQEYFFKINDMDDGWNQVASCGWDCGHQFTANNLPNSRYMITIHNSDWSNHCSVEINMTNSSHVVTAGSRNAAHLSFAAFQANRAVELQWLTNSGYKVSNFEVERSVDGTNFDQIAQFTNKEWSEDLAYHQTIDQAPTQGQNYYRVKEIYLDGTFAYTDVQKIGFQIDLEGISAFPNPAKDELFVSLKPFAGQEGNLTITNHFGQIIKQIELGEIAEDLIQINTSQLNNGLYYLNVQVANKKSFTKKVLVHRLY